MSRALRIAERLIREAVQYDTVTRQPYRYHQRDQPLGKYRGREDIFGSFTAIPKLGINPSTRYMTPIGVYGYPIDYLINKYNSRDETFDVPFAGSQPYLHIFQVSNQERGLLVFDRYGPSSAIVLGQYDDAKHKSVDEAN